MLAGLTGVHLLVLVAVVVVLFGATKLPIFARSLGQTVKVLRSELKPDSDTEIVTSPAPVLVELAAEPVTTVR